MTHYSPLRLLAHCTLICAAVGMGLPEISQAPAQAQSDLADYDIPTGHFFTQAHPDGIRGEGYAVSNSLGVPFWEAYLAAGGWQTLGYPLSRRYLSRGRVAQAFQFGTLVWNQTDQRVDLTAAPTPSELPPAARVPEPSHRAAAQSSRQPWSGWWWSVSGAGAALDAVGGPLWKYDRAVERARGVSPGTREWEASELSPSGLGLLWAGHCNGWAAAAILEEEPTVPRESGGVTFTVGDQKGLFSDLHFADAALWSYGGDGDVDPADFHRMLLSWIGEQKKAMIVTFRVANDEIWSYPAYRFELTYGPDNDEPEWSIVEATLWLVDNDVAPDFVGSRHWPSADGKEFQYRIKGQAENPSAGEWVGPSADGRFSHPFQIWYPDSSRRNLDRQLIAPGLDEGMIRQITGIKLPTPTPTATATATSTPRATVTSTPTASATVAATRSLATPQVSETPAVADVP